MVLLSIMIELSIQRAITVATDLLDQVHLVAATIGEDSCGSFVFTNSTFNFLLCTGAASVPVVFWESVEQEVSLES